MRAIRTEGQESHRKWVLNRRDKFVHLLATIPASLPREMLNLTVCCRYTQALLKNQRVNKYISKHHPEKLRAMCNLLDSFQRNSRIRIK
jgi:hypothetical protein